MACPDWSDGPVLDIAASTMLCQFPCSTVSLFLAPITTERFEVFRVTREIDFCYGHRLLNYDGKCRYLHGHNGRAVITIEGEKLDSRGMVLDFSDIKRTVSTWIDENLDHRMILCREDPVVGILKEMGEPLYLLDENPTAENIAKLIYTESQAHGFPIVEVKLWETPRCFATYIP
jgi:6-pyruvoyltetrahydropterin/6-carboxytetrahydropterin synthase